MLPWLCTRPGPMVLRCSIKYKVAPGDQAIVQHTAATSGLKLPLSGVMLLIFEINQESREE